MTEAEKQSIIDEAEKKYPDVLIEERGIMELEEMYEHNDMQGYKREGYIAGRIEERERTNELVKNIQHHIDMWSNEPERAIRLVQKEITNYQNSKTP